MAEECYSGAGGQEPLQRPAGLRGEDAAGGGRVGLLQILQNHGAQAAGRLLNYS